MVDSTLDRDFQRKVAQMEATTKMCTAPASLSTCSVEPVEHRTFHTVSARHSTSLISKGSLRLNLRLGRSGTEPWSRVPWCAPNIITKRAVSNGFESISVVLVDQSSSDDVSGIGLGQSGNIIELEVKVRGRASRATTSQCS